MSLSAENKDSAYTLGDIWAYFWEVMRQSHCEMLTCNISFKTAFSFFLAFDICDHHNGKTLALINRWQWRATEIWLPCFDRGGYWLAASFQNEARSTCVSWSFRLLSADSSISSSHKHSESSHVFWSTIHRQRARNIDDSMLLILWELGEGESKVSLMWKYAESSCLDSSLPEHIIIFSW